LYTVRQRVFSLALIGRCLLASGASASAQSSDYCDKVRARAKSDAASLIAPKLFGQALRYPTEADIATGVGPVSGRENYQLRFGLQFSPVDLARGIATVNASDSDCEAHIAADQIQRTIDDAQAAATLSAYRAQAKFLEEQRQTWTSLLSQTEKRLAAQLITQSDLQDVRQNADALERKLATVQGQVAQLEARGVEAPNVSLDELLHSYLDAELTRERGLSSARSWSVWSLGVTGGALLPLSAATSVDWFGWVELSYNLGGLWRGSYESAYLKAREAELHHARGELGQRVELLKRTLSAQRDSAQRELSLLGKQLSFLDHTLTALATADTATTAQAHDLLELERLSAQADEIQLRTLADALQWLGGTSHHD
jgi:hypothetical protein